MLEEFFNEYYSYQNLVENNTDNLSIGKPEWIEKSSQEIDLLITERNRVNHSKRKYRRKRQRAKLNKVSRLKVKVKYIIILINVVCDRVYGRDRRVRFR